MIISEQKQQKLLHLMTPQRYEKLMEILNNRSSHITAVAENFYNPSNVAALLRTIDATGFSDLYALEYYNRFDKNVRVSRGSEKWVNIHKYKKTDECFKALRDKGYRIYYADPDPANPDIDTLPLDKKVAILFGQENPGVSDRTKEIADGGFRIPMRGFVGSFNVSVSAAITLFTLRNRLEKEIKNYKLDADEKQALFNFWLKKNYNKTLEEV